MTSPKKIVVVLGNGFTKAFIPEMPLVKEGFEVGTLWDKFNETCSPEAHFILKQATEFKGKEKLEKITNIEVLMTRLDNYMPYDYKRKVVQELDKLYHDLKETFVDQIKTAVSQSLNSRNGKLPDLLYKFASHCISNKIDFLTFNYDDVFDRALFEKSSTFSQCPPPTSQIGCSWHPDWGYGFYLRSVYSLLDLPTFSILGGPAMSLLKLHGSINWRVQLGTSEIL